MPLAPTLNPVSSFLETRPYAARYFISSNEHRPIGAGKSEKIFLLKMA